MILCKIGDFELKAKEIESESKEYSYGYATLERVFNHPLYQAVKKDNETIKLQGYFLKQKQNILKALLDVAKEKKELRYTTIRTSYKVVIISISKGKSMFFRDVGLRESFTISMKRVYR